MVTSQARRIHIKAALEERLHHGDDHCSVIIIVIVVIIAIIIILIINIINITFTIMIHPSLLVATAVTICFLIRYE